MIVYITAGNSDDKLTQAEWADLCGRISHLVNPDHDLTHAVLGKWFSLPNEPWQNACWCVRIDAPGEKPEDVEHCANVIRTELGVLAHVFRQDSIVFAVAEPELLKAEPV